MHLLNCYRSQTSIRLRGHFRARPIVAWQQPTHRLSVPRLTRSLKSASRARFSNHSAEPTIADSAALDAEARALAGSSGCLGHRPLKLRGNSFPHQNST